METPAPRQRRILRVVVALLVLVALVGVFGFLAGPPLAKKFLVDAMSKELRRPVFVADISLNPYTLTVRVTGVSIGEKNGAPGETFGFDELFANVSYTSIARMAPVIEEFTLAGPRLRLVHESAGRYNISDLLDEWMKPSDSPPARFSVNNIRITAGRIEFDDRPVGRRHLVSDINLALPFVSNLPHQANTFTEPAFSASINGAPLELTGRSKPFADTKEAELKLDLDRFVLPPYLAYSPVALPFTLKSGQLDTDLAIVFRNDGKQSPTLSVAGKAVVSGIELAETDGAPLLSLARVEVPVGGLEPLVGKYRIGTVQIDGLETNVRADSAGDLNWLTIVDKLQRGGKPGAEAEAKPAAAGKPVEWSVEGVRLGNSAVHWLDQTHPQPMKADVTGIDVTVGKIDGRLSQPIAVDASLSLNAAPHVRLDKVALRSARIDVPGKKADIGELAVSNVKLAAGRNADGSMAMPQAPRLREAASGRTPAKVSHGETPPWTVSLGKLELSDASLRFDDKAVSPATTQTVDVAKMTLAGFSTALKTVATLELAARINRKGELKTSGTVQAEPLAAKLKLDLRTLELLPLQPYFGDKLNITITKGQVATRGDLALTRAADGSFGGGYRGEVTVGNFHSVDKPNSADFLTWKSFHVDKIDLKLQPFALAVGEVALSDFFASLYVSPEGRLNLMQIVRKDEAKEEPKDEKKTEGSAQTSPVPSADKTAAVLAKGEKVQPPPIRIDQVTLQGGTVNVDDHFIRPNYSAHLTEIGGRITGLSSEAGSAADLDLRGSYDGAPVSIAGKLNPLAALPSLDLRAEVRGVEMTPFSPYSGKYAGYAIDKGKLSLFLTYKLAENKLQAENRVFLDQLTFGEKVESPSATKLPVLLAVALLKNRKGEIDINLPISGSLDDPQFSVGGIIIQVIVNLITKAITAPFALLGSLFGGGEELSYADFAVGRASLSDATVKKLESLAKALDDRPALKLEVTGRIDPEKDREGLRQAALEHKVKAQKLAQLVKAGKEAGSVDDVTVDDKEYLPLLEQAYKAEKFPKPRNVIGLTKSLPREEMEKLMLANAPASDEDLRELANERAKSVADWLAGSGKISRERIFMLPPKLAKDDSGAKDAPLSRADFSLK